MITGNCDLDKLNLKINQTFKKLLKVSPNKRITQCVNWNHTERKSIWTFPKQCASTKRLHDEQTSYLCNNALIMCAILSENAIFKHKYLVKWLENQLQHIGFIRILQRGEHICMMAYRYSELLLLLPALSVGITIIMIAFILLRLCRFEYCQRVEIQRHRGSIIYSREVARSFDISRVPDRMENIKLGRMSVWADVHKTVFLLNTKKLIIPMVTKVKISHCVCDVKVQKMETII